MGSKREVAARWRSTTPFLGALLLLLLASAYVACDPTTDDEGKATSTPDEISTATPVDMPTREPTDAPTATAPRNGALGRGALVVRVIDGDTIEIEGGQRVRYIGIDTPESTTQHECFGAEASRRNTELVAGKTVVLEKDVSERDRYQRLLRYVWVDGVLINEVLVREGFATVSTYPPDVKYQERFLSAQAEARNTGAGLWGRCNLTPDGCDPSYPDVCIPPPPPYLDCRDVSHRRFRVLPPDPHEFDGNHDGVGCEGD